MNQRFPRIAARAVILHDNRLLLVNAYPGGKSDLWAAPGGGLKPGQSLPDTLAREVHEETGLAISVGQPCLVNEFHDPESGFHQVDIFFRATVTGGELTTSWRDPAGVVTERRFFSRDEMAGIRYKPSSLPQVAFRIGPDARYDPLERIVS